MLTPLSYEYQPIILIGAGRSGTKIIRDVIGSHPDIDTVPFDVNYIWTIGQGQAPDDDLNPDNLTEQNLKRIRAQFSRQSKGAPYLLEKTVSNSIRIPYVLKVFPNAKFIHLIRDGRDVTESVTRQWGEAREISYFFKKLKTFPIRYALGYLMDYGINWVKHGLGGKGQDDYIWGVRYPGYQKDLKEKALLEVCAIQWKTCVETSLTQLKAIDPDKLLEVRYETLMSDPTHQFQQIGDFIGVKEAHFEVSRFNTSNIGKYKKAWTPEQLDSVLKIIQPTLTQLNYN